MENIKIVVSCFNEDLSWLDFLPKSISIEIFNKGNEITDPIILQNPNIILHNKCQNIGRETETYLRYILKEYENLNDVTIFTQGNPFDHSPNFSNLIHGIVNNGMENNFLQLSSYWRINEVPPANVVKRDGGAYYTETASRYTMCPLKHWDEGVKFIYLDYVAKHPDIKKGDDVYNHFCNQIGLEDHEFGKTDTFRFSYSGIFAVKKEAIRKNSVNFYFNCYSLNNRLDIYGFFFERTWMKMFGQ